MADRIEIYDADNQEDWDQMNEKILLNLKQSGVLREDEYSYSSRGWHDKNSTKIGLIIESKWRDEIVQGLNSDEISKIRFISRETDSSYFNDEIRNTK